MNDYETLGVIGRGAFGTVSKVRRKRDNKIMVAKALDYSSMSDAEKRLVVGEVNILQGLRHPHIIKYYDRFIDRENEVIYIFMQYAANGDLSTLIKKCKQNGSHMPEDLIWKILHQLIQALKACHTNEQGVILHRDIKAKNVFLDAAGSVKLGDFGLARVLSEESLFAETFVGTPFYMSPEQVNGSKYDEKSDIWSLGCLLYEMMCLRPPFTAKSHAELYEKIKRGLILVDRGNSNAPSNSLPAERHTIPHCYSSEIVNVLQRMLTVDAATRPSVVDLENTPRILLLQREKAIKYHYAAIKQKQAELQAREVRLAQRERALMAKEKSLARLYTDPRDSPVGSTYSGSADPKSAQSSPLYSGGGGGGGGGAHDVTKHSISSSAAVDQENVDSNNHYSILSTNNPLLNY